MPTTSSSASSTRRDARRFLDELRERLQEFALSLHPEKTRLIEFGRFAAKHRKRRGLGKPETFNFLGFTFICGKTRSGQIPDQKEDPAGPHAGEAQGGSNRRCGGACTSRSPSGEMAGACRHAATSTTTRCRPTFAALAVVPDEVAERWRRALSRRSQTGRPHVDTDDASWRTTGSHNRRILHPWPSLTLRRQTPEVGAVCGKAARPDLCGGRAVKRASLPLPDRFCCTAYVASWHIASNSLQCTNSRAIGGTADMPRTRRAYRSGANDPELTQAGSKCRTAASTCCNDLLCCNFGLG